MPRAAASLGSGARLRVSSRRPILRDLFRRGRRRAIGVLLRGGQVIDPGAGLTGALDVRVRDGLVTEVRAGLAPDGDTELDVSGRLVLPGLIDLHAHCLTGASEFGPRPDDGART